MNSLPPAPLRVALLGNPNTGKSTLFNCLSGLRQQVGNYPGVTVEKKVGTTSDGQGSIQLIDLPGTYSLAPRSPDEMVAVDVLLGTHLGTSSREPPPDVILAVVDAANLDRNLFLATQLMELGRPLVIALTMVDVALAKGIQVDPGLLSQHLGITVVPVNAPKGIGLGELKSALRQASTRPPPSGVELPAVLAREAEDLQQWLLKQAPELAHGGNGFLARRVLIDVDGYLERTLAKSAAELPRRLQAARDRLKDEGCPVPGIEAKTRYAWIRRATAASVRRGPSNGPDWTGRLDAILTHRIWGLAIFLLAMALIFQSIFVWASPLMDAIDSAKGALGDWITASMAPGPLRSLLVQGVLEGVGGVLIFLPQIMILFAFIAVLEDCGYMARAAFLMDKVMSRCGLSGKSFIPLLSSFACAIPGIMAARVIEDRRDRLTTILVAPLMSCSARLPVYLLLAETFFAAMGWWVPGLVIFAMYLLGLLTAPFVAWLLKRTVLRGEAPIFLMEMPPYRWPSIRLVLYRMFDRGWAFVRRAGTVILATMILVWALLYFPHHDAAGRLFEDRVAELEAQAESLAGKLDALADDAPARKALQAELDTIADQQNALLQEWRTNSYLGRLGHFCEPVFRPLGWDWRLTMAALASFPAREVVVGTLGIIYREGEIDAGDEEARRRLGERLRAAEWDAGSERAGMPVFTLGVALSLMVFFVFCCQCASTLAVLKRETNGWGWPLFAFVYMTALAYLAALAVYQLSLLG